MHYPRHHNVDIFVLPSKSPQARQQGLTFLDYAPRSGKAFLCTPKALQSIEQDLSKGKRGEWYRAFFPPEKTIPEQKLPNHPDDYRKLTVIPSLACNFTCSYCYAAQGRAQKKISRDTLQAGLDYFLRPNRQQKHLKIMITGGGEPLTAWEEVAFLLDYSQALAQARDYHLYDTLMTNGGLLDRQKLTVLKQHGVHICVSFDLTEKAQNLSRKHYTKVRQAIDLGCSEGAYMSLSATVTPETVEELPSMFATIQRDFPLVRDISIEPVTLNEGFESPQKAQDFYDRFTTLFFQYLPEDRRESISCSPLDFMTRHTTRCCPGKLCLTPGGDFSICHCVSAPTETRYRESTYGSVTQNHACEFDLQKFKDLLRQGTNDQAPCDECFARHHCGGMCLTRKACYSPETQRVYCNFMRTFIQTRLEEECLRKAESCCWN